MAPDEDPIRALVIDDERLARQRLDDLLAEQADVVVVDLIGDGRAAIEAIRSQDPDLVFLDVQMPDLTGIEVVREVGAGEMPLVIFVTAYDEYAVQAFDLAAIDYLLKPFENERFEQALERAREVLRLRDVDDFRGRLEELLEGKLAGSTDGDEEEREYARRIAVESRGKIRVVPVEDVDFFTASGSYVEIHAGDDRHLIRETMQDLEDSLDPSQFFRIHRSHIVRLDRIESLLVNAGGDYAVRLQDGKKLKVSRRRKEELEDRLGLQS